MKQKEDPVSQHKRWNFSFVQNEIFSLSVKCWSGIHVKNKTTPAYTERPICWVTQIVDDESSNGLNLRRFVLISDSRFCVFGVIITVRVDRRSCVCCITIGRLYRPIAIRLQMLCIISTTRRSFDYEWISSDKLFKRITQLRILKRFRKLI